MKIILRFLGAIMIGNASLTSIRTCNNTLPWAPPQSDTVFARLLGWYNDDNITKITQKLHYNDQTNMYEIIINNKIITNTNSKQCLLISNGNYFMAKNIQAANLLKQFGFTSGGVKTAYSIQEVDKISNLTAVIDKVNYGKITVGSYDYSIDNGTMKVSIKLNNKTLKTYSLDILNNNLNILDLATHLVNSNTISLTKSSGFAIGCATSNYTLNLKTIDKQDQWNALLNFLHTTPSLTWTDSEKTVIETFKRGSMWLQISFGKIIVVPLFNCGNL